MKNRRFIAGAVCPQCGTKDRIYTGGTDATGIYRCIACNHTCDDATNEPLRNQPDADTQPVHIISPAHNNGDPPASS